MKLPSQLFPFTLLTPCFSGIALGKSADRAEMRVPPIRGHVRMWHRELFGSDDCNRVWGSTNGNEGHGSLVGLALEAPAAQSVQRSRLLPHANPQSRDFQEGQKAKSDQFALPKGTACVLRLQRFPACSKKDWEHAQCAVKLWLVLGGLGLRSNRAAGSVWPVGDWVPQTINDLRVFLQQPGFKKPIRIAGLDKNLSPEKLREIASDTVGGQGRNHPQFGGIKPREPSPTRFKVIRLGLHHALIITGPDLAAAYNDLMGKPNQTRWQTLGPWTSLAS